MQSNMHVGTLTKNIEPFDNQVKGKKIAYQVSVVVPRTFKVDDYIDYTIYDPLATKVKDVITKGDRVSVKFEINTHLKNGKKYEIKVVKEIRVISKKKTTEE